MRVLIDITHPAHVHFFRHIRAELVAQGAEVLVVARDKDVTLELLEALEIPYLPVGRSGHRSMAGQLVELVQRDWFLVRQGRRFRPDVILTRNPSGVQAARVLRTIGVFDTDDGRSVGVHFRAAAPFAHLITAPDCLTESFGHKARKYPSYKALAYLHPARFTPDPGVRDEVGVSGGERYSVLRLVAHDASHDRHAAGIAVADLRALVAVLRTAGPVFTSAEGTQPPIEGTEPLPVSPHRLHDLLAGAAVVVGDSQSVITEAALLGTPAFRINTWAGATPYLEELEHRYQLARSWHPRAAPRAVEHIASVLDDPQAPATWQRRRARMLEEKVDLTRWYVDFVEQVVVAATSRRRRGPAGR